MSRLLFGIDDWEPLFKISKDMAVDSEGNFSMRIGDSIAMDMNTGEPRFTTSWGSDEDSDEDF